MVRFLLHEIPGRLAHESMDGVSVLGLGQRQLHPLAVELVAAVLDPVRPRREHLAATGGRPLAGRDLDLAGDCHLDAHTPTLATTVGAAPRRSSRWSPTRREFAIAVSAGLTAPMLGKMLVSTT